MATRGKARTGRGWDAAPPRAAKAADTAATAGTASPADTAGADASEQARQVCLRLLAVRPRTTSELTTALRRRGFAEDVVAEVLGRYREVGMVDDAAFARAWVSSRHHGRGLGQRVLADELLRRGIDAALVDDALIQVAGDVETQTARQLVRSWLHREAAAADPAPEQTFRRLVARLIRKGYPVGIACSAVKDELVDVPIPDDLDVDLIEAQLREQDG